MSVVLAKLFPLILSSNIKYDSNPISVSSKYHIVAGVCSKLSSHSLTHSSSLSVIINFCKNKKKQKFYKWQVKIIIRNKNEKRKRNLLLKRTTVVHPSNFHLIAIFIPFLFLSSFTICFFFYCHFFCSLCLLLCKLVHFIHC